MDITALPESIKLFYKNNNPELCLTEHICKILAHGLMKKIDKGDVNINKDFNTEFFLFLSDVNTINFIKERMPVELNVSDEVVSNITNYFSKSLPSYSPLEIYRKSNHRDDDYLYCVVAQNKDGSFACWSSWNENTQDLNHGHYGISELSDAREVLKELFNDITDEPEKYGMERYCKVISDPQAAEKGELEKINDLHHVNEDTAASSPSAESDRDKVIPFRHIRRNL